MTKSNLFRDVISKMMESVTLDNDGQLKVLNEESMSEADDLLNQMVVETARDWWAQLESAEDSLADMADEISFNELNADPSHVGSPALDLDKDEGPEGDMQNVDTMESLLGKDDFDLNSIFEGFREDEDDDIGMDDGDDDFSDLMRGDDDKGLGDSGPMGDDGMEDDGMDAIGGNDDIDMGDDDIDMDDDDMDMGDEDEFNFDFLDDDDGLDMDDDGLDMGDDDFSMGDDDMGDEDEFETDDDQNLVPDEEEIA